VTANSFKHDYRMFHAQRRSLLRATLGGVVSIASAPVMAAIAAPSRPIIAACLFVTCIPVKFYRFLIGSVADMNQTRFRKLINYCVIFGPAK